MDDEEHRRRCAEDFRFMVTCHAKGNPAMYQLLRDRSLDAAPPPKENEMNWQCPTCQSTTALVVVISTAARLTQHKGNFETEVTGDHEWDEQSPMRCEACGKRGVVKEFEVK